MASAILWKKSRAMAAFMCNWPSTFKMFSFIFYGASKMKVVVLIPKLVVGSKSSLWRVSELFLCGGSSCKAPIRLQLCFYLFLAKWVKLKEGLKWNFHLAWEPFSVKDPCRWGSCAVWRETCIYNQYDNLLTYNNTSPPPRSFDCKWGHFPLL